MILKWITILLRMVLVSPLRSCAVIVIWFSPDLASGDVKCRKGPSAGMVKTCLVFDDHRGASLPPPYHFHHPAVLDDSTDFQEGLIAGLRLLDEIEPVG